VKPQPLHTMIEEVHSDENGTLGHTANVEHFCLGLPICLTSPPQFSNQPTIPSSQQEHTMTATIPPHENQETLSPSHPPCILLDPPSDDSNNLMPDGDSNNEYEDSLLPTPHRLREQFRRPSNRSNESTHWQRHVFRLVERDGCKYYDVRGDAVSSSGNA
jgi:hypothetical protein